MEELQNEVTELRAKRDLQLELISEEKNRHHETLSKKISLLLEIEAINHQIQDIQ
jgi:hypothetical protein